MEKITSLVQRWVDAELAGDAAAMDTLLTDDFIGVGPVGFVLNRAQWLGRHESGSVRNHEFSVTDLHIRVYNDTALVSATETQRTTARGFENNGSFRLGIVAVLQETWKIAHIQFSGPLIAPGEVPDFVKAGSAKP